VKKKNFYPSVLWIGGLLLFSGCASLSDYHYEYTQRLRARTQYHECGNPQCSQYPRDYKKGWLDGFYDVSTGGPDCPPAIAPCEYWKPGQILEHCDNRRHAYYSGWQDGAARASQFPDTHYLKIFETCECPFPRCECVTCGQTPCSCHGSGGSLPGDGMMYHPGAIESDREIMMVPIPNPEESPGDAAPVIPGPTPAEPPFGHVINTARAVFTQILTQSCGCDGIDGLSPPC